MCIARFYYMYYFHMTHFLYKLKCVTLNNDKFLATHYLKLVKFNLRVLKQLLFEDIKHIDLLVHFLSSKSTNKVALKPQNSLIDISNICL